MQELIVSAVESGQKLLNFLLRRVQAEKNELHRWIRSGQVRINKGRAKAFDRLNTGDSVRIPPFAIFIKGEASSPIHSSIKHSHGLHILYENEDILVIDKERGLACQGGTGHNHNIVTILKESYAEAPFMPAPAHRIDKDTTGILFIGKSYSALRSLTDFMKHEQEETLNPRLQADKEYLAWLHGDVQSLQKSFIVDYVYKDENIGIMKTVPRESFLFYEGKREHIKGRHFVQKVEDVFSAPMHKEYQGHTSQKAISFLQVIKTIQHKKENYSLVKVGIFTGRTHQIRLQCANLGFPLVGDAKYGQKDGEKLKLHSYHIHLGQNNFSHKSDFYSLPSDWEYPFALDKEDI